MRRSRKEISEADSRIRPSSRPTGMPYPFMAYDRYARLSSRMPNVCNMIPMVCNRIPNRSVVASSRSYCTVRLELVGTRKISGRVFVWTENDFLSVICTLRTWKRRDVMK